MNVVDASVIVSYLVPQDRHHAVSRKWIRHQVAHHIPIVSPFLLLPEVGGAISRRTGDPTLSHRALTALQNLSNLRLVAIDEVLAAEATRCAVDYQLRGADAVYVAVASLLKLPLISLDNEHQTRVGDFITVVPPT